MKQETVAQEPKTQVAVQQAAQLPANTEMQNSVMDQDVVSSDVPIPRLLLCQAISERVMDGLATVGQIVRSTDNALVAERKVPIKIIPLKIENIWINQEFVGKKAEFRSTEPRTAANTDLPWQYKKDGTDWQRVKAVTLYGILPKDVDAYTKEIERATKEGDAPDLSKTLMPVVITFQSTSFKPAAKPIAEFFQKLKTMSAQFPNVGPFNYTVELSSKEEKGDKGQYFVWEAGKTEANKDKNAMEAAKTWFKILQTSKVRVDDASTDEETTVVGSSDLV